MRDAKDKLLQSISSNRKILIDLSIIAFIGLISLFWFRGNYLVKTGDDFFPLDPVYVLSICPYVWLHLYSTGLVMDPFGISNLPFYAFLSGFNAISFSIVTLQKIFYYFTFTFSGISAYFLTTSLLTENKRVAGLASALFYMMNPYSLSVVWAAHYTTLFFAYSSAPLFLALFIKGIMSKQPGRYAIYVGLLELLFSPMFDDPSVASIILLWIPALFLFYYLIIQRKDKTRLLSASRFCFYFIVVSVVINFWWILPAIYLGYTRFALDTGAYSSSAVFIGGSISSTMWNSLRLLGDYYIWAKWYPVSIYAWTETYSSATFVFLSILIPITAFAALTLKTRDKYCLFFALLSVLGLFLAKGVAEPLGNINLWLFQNVPLAVAFRTQFVCFGLVIVLGFTFLIGVTIGELWKRFRQTQFTSHRKIKLSKYAFKRRASPKAVVLASILIVLTVGFVIYNYPFWNGDVIYPGSQYLPSARIEVPSYYTDVGNYINGQPGDFRIMDIPPRLQGTSAYAWEHGYIASDPIDEYYIHKPLIGVGFFSDIELQLFNMLSSAEVPQSFAKTLALMNCKYLLVHNDFNSSLINAPGINDTFDGFYLEKTFGQLDLYRNEYWTPLQLYSTSNAILVQGNFSDMFQLLEGADYTVGDNLLLLSNQLNSNQLANLPETIVKYSPVNVSMQVLDGWVNRVNWSSINSSSINSYVARYYTGWKGVISTCGAGDPDMLVFSSPNNCSYFNRLDGSGGWSSFDSTLIYIVTDDKPLSINSILANGQSVSDVTIFWQTGSTGSFKPILYPVEIPPHQKAIIQINHIANTVNLLINPEFSIPSAADESSITYQEINPTKYLVNVNASEPYFLVFSESYDNGWVTSINGQQIPNEYHFTANGYANGWYINKTGTYTITLEFWPQNLFYIGSAISITTLILCISYVSKDKIKTIYRKHIKNKQVSKVN